MKAKIFMDSPFCFCVMALFCFGGLFALFILKKFFLFESGGAGVLLNDK